MQPAFQPRIVEVGTPSKPRGGFAGARRGKRLARRQGFVVAPPGVWIAISELQIFRLGQGKDVGDIAGLAIAGLDADRIRQNQTRQPRRRFDRNLSGNPGAERYADQCYVAKLALIEEVEIKVR